MPLVDLDDPEELRARWSALAAVAHATGFDRRWYADENGWYHQDETGSDLRMVRLEGGRAVLFGFHTQHSMTAEADLLAGSPDWIGQPEVKRRIAAGELGFVYGSFNGTWARASYPGDPWQPLDDGFAPIAQWVTSDEEAAREMIEWAAEWADYLGGLDELLPVGIGLIRTAASTGITSDALLDLFDRLGVGAHSPQQPDLRAALAAAEQFNGTAPAPAVSAAPAPGVVPSVAVEPEPVSRFEPVDDEVAEESFIVPPGISPFTGQPIGDDANQIIGGAEPFTPEPPLTPEPPFRPDSPFAPEPPLDAGAGTEPQERSEEEGYGVTGRKQRRFRRKQRPEDGEALARLGLAGPEPAAPEPYGSGQFGPGPEPMGPEPTGYGPMGYGPGDPAPLGPLPSAEPPRVGGQVDEGEDYYASLFADAPAAATYVPDVVPDANQDWDGREQSDQPAWSSDDATSEFFPFTDDTAAASITSPDDDTGSFPIVESSDPSAASASASDDTGVIDPVPAEVEPRAAASASYDVLDDRGVIEAQPSPLDARTAEAPPAEPVQREWVGGAWINGEWVEDVAAYLAAQAADPGDPQADQPYQDVPADEAPPLEKPAAEEPVAEASEVEASVGDELSEDAPTAEIAAVVDLDSEPTDPEDEYYASASSPFALTAQPSTPDLPANGFSSIDPVDPQAGEYGYEPDSENFHDEILGDADWTADQLGDTSWSGRHSDDQHAAAQLAGLQPAAEFAQSIEHVARTEDPSVEPVWPDDRSGQADEGDALGALGPAIAAAAEHDPAAGVSPLADGGWMEQSAVEVTAQFEAVRDDEPTEPASADHDTSHQYSGENLQQSSALDDTAPHQPLPPVDQPQYGLDATRSPEAEQQVETWQAPYPDQQARAEQQFDSEPQVWDDQQRPSEHRAEATPPVDDAGGPVFNGTADGVAAARARELVAPPPSTPIAIPGLGMVGGDGPRVEPTPGSIEEAMRAEFERPRPRPQESPALEALREWCRERTKIVPSGFTIQVQVLDPAAPSYRFDLEPPEVHEPQYAPERLSELLGELWLAESEGEQGGWLFARIDAAGRTLRIDRWYDQVPDWWDNPIEPRLDVLRLVRRLNDRGPDWQPSYLEKLYTTAR